MEVLEKPDYKKIDECEVPDRIGALELKIELILAMLENQGSTEKPSFSTAAVIAAPPGLSIVSDTITDVYEFDWNNRLKACGTEKSRAASSETAGSYAALCSLIKEAKDNNGLRAAAVMATIKGTATGDMWDGSNSH